MMENCQVRFGGGPMEKCPNRQLASGLPYFISPELDRPREILHVLAHELVHYADFRIMPRIIYWPLKTAL